MAISDLLKTFPGESPTTLRKLSKAHNSAPSAILDIVLAVTSDQLAKYGDLVASLNTTRQNLPLEETSSILEAIKQAAADRQVFILESDYCLGHGIVVVELALDLEKIIMVSYSSG